MELKCAKISNHASNKANPNNAVLEMKGQKGVCTLACGINMPKADAETTPAKIAGIITESFMKRPSLSTEASDAIYKRANDRVLLDQSPQYPACVSASSIYMLKNKFVMATAGDNVIFHFVNGQLRQVFAGDMGNDPLYLGHVRYSSPKTGEAVTFGKGTNTFLICSKKFAQALNEEIISNELIRATHVSQKGSKQVSEVKCDRWLKALWDNLGRINPNDDYSAIAFSLPEKRKSTKTLVIGIVIAVVVAVLAFLAVGFFTHPKKPDQRQQMQQGQEGDPNTYEKEVGPNGELPPDPPTRPATESK